MAQNSFLVRFTAFLAQFEFALQSFDFHREANRAESREDFVHKTGIAEKEAAEAEYWLELCVRRKIGSDAAALHLLAEASELLAIITTINRKGKNR